MNRVKNMFCGIVILSSSGCFGTAHQAQIGADGVPVFQGRDFRHAAGTPFWCFDHVAYNGDEISSCHEIKEWCTRELATTNADGFAVLSGCEAKEEVACLTFYRGDASRTSCHATPDDCQSVYNAYTSPNYGANANQLTPCTDIDTSFQPSS